MFNAHFSLDQQSAAALLVNVSLKVAIILAAASAVCGLMHRQSAAIRHRVWTVATALSLLMPIVVVCMPNLPVFKLPSQVAPSVELNSESNGSPATGPMALLPQDSAVLMRTLPSESGNEDIQNTTAASTVTTAGKSATRTDQLAASRVIPEKAEDRHVGQSAMLISLWAIGACLVAIPLGWLLILQRSQKRQLRRLKDNTWDASVQATSGRLQLRSTVTTFESHRGTVPAVFGILRPYLVVPDSWREWSGEQRDCILLHELAHVKRFDVATQFLGRLVVVIYWFNPLSWYAIRQMRIERELACDDCVLTAGKRPSDYAQQLLQTLRQYRTQRFAAGVAMAHSAKLDQRVIAILDPTRSRSPMRSITSFAFATSAVLVAVLLGAASFAEPPAAIQETERTPSDSTKQDADTNKRHEESKRSEESKPPVGNDAHETWDFTGQVLHGEEPIEGATVTLWQRTGPEGFYKDWHPLEAIDVEPQQVGVSDQTGQVRFSLSSSEMKDTPWNRWPQHWGRVQVVVSKPGMGVGWCTLEQFKERKKIWIRNTAPLRGRVIDLEGQPVANCQVRFLFLRDEVPSYQELWQSSWTGLSKDVVTDASGKYEMLGLPTNRKGIRLVFSGPSIATKIVAFDMGKDGLDGLEVIAEPTKPISGIVRDIETGEPVPGMIVYGNEEKMLRTVRAVTNERGEYRLTGFPKSKLYELTLRAPFSTGYLVRYSDVLDSPGLSSIAHDIKMRKGVPVHVTVVDKHTRKRLHPELHYAPTADNPLFRESMRHLFWPTEGYQQFYAPDENGVVRFIAYPGRGLLRTILQGAPYLPVAETEEIKKNQATDLNFAFASSSAAYAVIEPHAGKGILEIELEADAGQSASANLIGEDGNPIVGVEAYNLYFNTYMDRHSVSGTGWPETLEESRFTARLLEPGKQRLLVFLHEQDKLIGTTIVAVSERTPDVTLRKWGSVTGIVKDSGGNALANIDVYLHYPSVPGSTGNWPEKSEVKMPAKSEMAMMSGSRERPPTVRTDESGRFSIERLMPGSSHRLVIKASLGFAPKEVADIQPDVGESIDVGEIRLSETAPK